MSGRPDNSEGRARRNWCPGRQSRNGAWRGGTIAVLTCLVSACVLVGSALGQQRRSPIDVFDRNGDGKVSRREFRGPAGAFDKLDRNNDGFITRKEVAHARARKHQGGGGPAGGRTGGGHPGGSRQGGKRPEGKQPPEAKPYKALVVDIYVKGKVHEGTVFFVDSNRMLVAEVDLQGKILWEYQLPQSVISCGIGAGSRPQGGCGVRLSDVELLPNGNVLLMNGGDGVYEVNRKGKIVWSYKNPIVSHDADRLPNGNTLMACANAERLSEFPYEDPQVIEVNPKGQIVWKWHAKDHYLNSEYKDIRGRDWDDWTHVNSVTRLPDGNTMISVRNWGVAIAVDKGGKTVWTIGGPDVIRCPHTPQLLANGNLLVSESMPGRVIEFDPKSQSIVWSYPDPNWRRGGEYLFIRDAQRLPNGNTFVVDSLGSLIEVTPENEVVWRARVPDYPAQSHPLSMGNLRIATFFKADRSGVGYYGGR